MTTPDPSSSPTPKDLPGPLVFLGLGLTIACTVGAFVGLGIWGDAAFHTSPLCLVIGLVVGCGVAATSTVALVRRYL